MKKISSLMMMVLITIFLENTGCKKENPQPTATPLDKAPQVNAGIDIALEIPNNTALFTATATNANSFSKFDWKKISGPHSGYLEQDGLKAKAIWLEEGIYEFEFSAVDSKGLSSKDTIQVTVSTELRKHIVSGLKPNSSGFTEIELPEEVFKNLRWAYCKSSQFYEKADAGPLANIDYNWGGWYFTVDTNNKIAVFGGYYNEKFDLIIYY